MVPGTGAVSLSVGPLPELDVAGLIRDLDRYPYGCSEQTVSRAMPLLYLSELGASEIELDGELKQRLQDAVARLLNRQSVQRRFRPVARPMATTISGSPPSSPTSCCGPARRASPCRRSAGQRGRLSAQHGRQCARHRERQGRGHRLCALCAGPRRPRAGGRPQISRRHQDQRLRLAAGPRPDRGGARHARRQAARRAGLRLGARGARGGRHVG